MPKKIFNNRVSLYCLLQILYRPSNEDPRDLPEKFPDFGKPSDMKFKQPKVPMPTKLPIPHIILCLGLT